jgi:Trypsin
VEIFIVFISHVSLNYERNLITVNVERTFIHPNFTESKQHENNVALILVRKIKFDRRIQTFFYTLHNFFQMSGSFNLSEIRPRKLGKLNSNSSCNLYGWGGREQFPRRQSVEVFHPSYCNPVKPKMFCSSLGSINDSSCDANPGSPLICDESSFMAGFVSQIDRKCVEVGEKVLIEFQSIGDSINWIERVSAGTYNQNISILVFFSLLVSIKLSP